MKRFIAHLVFAITVGLLFAALGTFAGAVLHDTYISGSYAAEEDCEYNTCDDLSCTYTQQARTCRILESGECVTGAC